MKKTYQPKPFAPKKPTYQGKKPPLAGHTNSKASKKHS